ncbi:hypothetical protein D3C79_900420 [compost metagenome]
MRKRLMKTEATLVRSSGTAVSFSTIEAMVNNSSGVLYGKLVSRLCQAASSVLIMRRCARLSNAISLMPAVYR